MKKNIYLAKQQLPTTENKKYINENKTVTARDTHKTTGSHTEADLNVGYFMRGGASTGRAQIGILILVHTRQTILSVAPGHILLVNVV